jgi:hypothetical protein
MTLGVYLLGALDPGERFAFESHLSYCEVCRGELVRLAPLPGLLNQITPDDFADSMPSTEVEGFGPVTTRVQRIIEPLRIPEQAPSQPPLPPLPSVPPVIDEAPPRNRPKENRPEGGPRSAPARRRVWRVRSAAAAVVILAVGAIFGWQSLRHEPAAPPAAQGVVWTGTSMDGTASVEARLVDREWGTEFLMKFHGMPPDRECYLNVYDHYGNRQVAGWWSTDHDPNDVIPGAVSIRRSKIDRLEVMLEDKETLVLTIEAPH